MHGARLGQIEGKPGEKSPITWQPAQTSAPNHPSRNRKAALAGIGLCLKHIMAIHSYSTLERSFPYQTWCCSEERSLLTFT